MATNDASSSADRDPIGRIAESFLEGFRRGERPSVDDYARQHPELAEEVRELLPALVQLERNKSAPGDATGSFDGGARASTLAGVPRRLGDYTILREIGRGGMGVVYEAVQQSLGRHVALKVLPWHQVGLGSQLERFRLEARSAARLHHSNIVPVFGVGEHGGVHYYAMQFIPGQGLDDVIAELRRPPGDAPPPGPSAPDGTAATIAQTVARGLRSGRFGRPRVDGDAAAADATPGATTTGIGDEVGGDGSDSRPSGQSELTGTHDRRYYRQVARLALQVAEALAYAHGQGILHRDIKPSNLLLDARGTVWIADFGLAKAEGSDGPTRTGDLVGTLRYMAPERFEGRSDRRGDVYALGATLYELTTLQPLFGMGDRPKLIDRILHEPPTPPRRLDRRVPRDLETIILKALAREPGRRYRDAEAMAADLRRFLDDRPILTRRVGPAEQAWRWARRNPAVAGLLTTAALLMLAAIAGLGFGYRESLRRLEVESSRLRAEAGLRAEAERQAVAAREAEAEAGRRAAESEAVITFLTEDMLTNADPYSALGEEFSVIDLLDRAAEAIEVDGQFADQPLVEATIRDVLGRTYQRLNKPEAGWRHTSRAFELRRAILGEGDPRTLETMEEHAWHLFGSRPEEAERIVARGLEAARAALGPDHPLAFAAIIQLAMFYRDHGKLQEARDLLGPALDEMRRVLAPDDMLITGAGLIYGSLLFDQDRPDEVERLIGRAFERLSEVRGPHHPETLRALRYLAIAHYKHGKLEEARTLNRDLVRRSRLVHPPGYISRAIAVLNLALTLQRTGDRDEEMDLLEEEYAAIREQQAPEDRLTIRLRGMLANALVLDGQSARACEIRGEAAEAAIELLGPADPLTARILGRYARDLARVGDPDRARRVIGRLLDRLRGALGHDRAAVAKAANSLVWSMANAQGNDPSSMGLAEAIDLLEAAVAAAPDGQTEANYRNTLGVALYRDGDWADAIAELEESDRLDEADASLASNGFFLAMAHRQLGHDETAREHFDRSVAWMEGHAPDEPELLRFRAEAEALLRLLRLDDAFPADPFIRGR